MASSQTQNVQRGIVFMLFVQAILLLIVAIYKMVKKQIDPIEEDEGGRKEDYKESQEHIGESLDKIAAKKPQLKEDATCIQKFFFTLQEFSYLYAPVLILLPLNIITGTSKTLCFILYFGVMLCISLFNQGKVHKKLGDNKCVGVVFQNLWLLLCFFFLVNHWGAFTIYMPYSLQ